MLPALEKFAVNYDTKSQEIDFKNTNMDSLNEELQQKEATLNSTTSELQLF